MVRASPLQRLRARLLLSGALMLLLLIFLFAQLELERAGYRLPSTSFEELTLPDPPAFRASVLNYETFAADLGWIGLVVNYGEGRKAKARFQNLRHNAEVVQELDPRFYRLYDWFPAIYLSQRYPIPFEDAEIAADFVEEGIEAFPRDGALAFHAGMSFIGIENPVGEGPERRYQRIVELAELAAMRGDPDAAGVLPFYRAKLSGGDAAVSREAEAEFLTTLFARAKSDRERKQIREQLERLLRDPEVAASRLKKFDEFNARHQAEAGHLSPELYALVYR